VNEADAGAVAFVAAYAVVVLLVIGLVAYEILAHYRSKP
jgi:hypothetical protein